MIKIILTIFILLSLSPFANELVSERIADRKVKCEHPLSGSTSEEVDELASEVDEKIPYLCMEEKDLNKRCQCFSDISYTMSKEEHSNLAQSLRDQYLEFKLQRKLNKLNEKWYYYKKLFSINKLELPKCKLKDEQKERLDELNFWTGDSHYFKHYGNPFSKQLNIYRNLKGLGEDKHLYKSYLNVDSFNAFTARVLLLSERNGKIDQELLEKNYHKLIDEYVASYLNIKKSEVKSKKLRADTFDLLNLVANTVNGASVLTEENSSNYEEFKGYVVGTMSAYLVSAYNDYEADCLNLQKEVNKILALKSAPIYSIEGIPFTSFMNSLKKEDDQSGYLNRPEVSFLYCQSVKEHIPEVYDDYMSATRALFSFANKMRLDFVNDQLKLNIENPISPHEGRGIVATARSEIILDESFFSMDFKYYKRPTIVEMSAVSSVESRLVREVSLEDVEGRQESIQRPRGASSRSFKPTVNPIKETQRKIINHVAGIVNRREASDVVKISEKLEQDNGEESSESKREDKIQRKLNLHNYFTSPRTSSLTAFYKFDYVDPYSIKGAQSLSIVDSTSSNRKKIIDKIKARNKRIPDSVRKYNDYNQVENSESVNEARVKKSELFDYYRPVILPDNTISQRKSIERGAKISAIKGVQGPSQKLESFTAVSENIDTKRPSSSSASSASSVIPMPAGMMATSRDQKAANSETKEIGISSSKEGVSKAKNIARSFLLENEFKSINDTELSRYKTSSDFIFVFISREVYNIPVYYLQTYRIVYSSGEYQRELISTESLYRVDMNSDKIRVINEFFDLKKKGEIL
ncbi:hypothetical protein [Halobacteriovorax sp. JY17]|uniref:hypothetical protein n=1 Tax=Halobacteriovorax sp. JY17 TaxID=2014617 RepID=UPI000C56B760|nr:hypothetical protein [Halobacteriovorax sp. JY17]PIK15608.1 MAG: hypothetical protein CES88_02470 [Halobacteriovorax sp. JY17]